MTDILTDVFVRATASREGYFALIRYESGTGRPEHSRAIAQSTEGLKEFYKRVIKNIQNQLVDSYLGELNVTFAACREEKMFENPKIATTLETRIKQSFSR